MNCNKFKTDSELKKREKIYVVKMQHFRTILSLFYVYLKSIFLYKYLILLNNIYNNCLSINCYITQK